MFVSLAILAVMLWACAGPQLQQDVERPQPSFALAPATTGVLEEIAGRIQVTTGPEYSRFHLLDGNHTKADPAHVMNLVFKVVPREQF